MRCIHIEFHSPLAEPIRSFVAHKRALNRRFYTEERALCLCRHQLRWRYASRKAQALR
jgi:hypothetical protein